MTEIPAPVEPALEMPRGAYETFLAMSAIAFVLFILFAFAFGYWGENVVSGLDNACAEAVFDAANKLRSEGHDELAIQRFRQALGGHFKDAQRRLMCGRALGDLLNKQKRYDEAIEVYRALPAEAFTFAGAYAGYVDALYKQEYMQEAEKQAKVWLAKAQAEKSTEQIEWANAILLRLAERAGRQEEALAYAKAAIQVNPESDAGMIAARILHRLGRKDEALAQLDAFLAATDDAKLRPEAEQLKAQLLDTPQ